jgi:hypothetical protein
LLGFVPVAVTRRAAVDRRPPASGLDSRRWNAIDDLAAKVTGT